MPSLKEYNVKLASLANTRKMTKTMQMVSASKLRKAQEAEKNASHYAAHMRELIGRLTATTGAFTHPLMDGPAEIKKSLVLVFTSDKGLCGGFNNNLCKYLRKRIPELPGEVHLAFCGRRGYMALRREAPVKAHFEDVTAHPSFANSRSVSHKLRHWFLDGEFDAVYFCYNQFVNALTQTPTLWKILPLSPEIVRDEEEAFEPDYIFEPDRRILLETLLPKALDFQVHFAVLENSAGEHGARMTAMDNATANAAKLIDHYTLLRNRARQAAITTEMIEIVSGAEAAL